MPADSSKPRLSTSAEAEEKARNRGLSSIQQARDDRAEGKTRWPSPKFWAYAGIILAISAILHWKWSDAEVERTKQKLLADGLFEVSRKRSLPRFPTRIGIVTSPEGAVIRDFIEILSLGLY